MAIKKLLKFCSANVTSVLSLSLKEFLCPKRKLVPGPIVPYISKENR